VEMERKTMVSQTDPSIRILALEQKLVSYQRLHAEELNELSLALSELRKQVLDMARSRQPAADPSFPTTQVSD